MWRMLRCIAQEFMLRSGKLRSASNDTTLSDRELRKVEADGIVLEEKLNTVRKQQDDRAEDLIEYIFTCCICLEVQADAPLDALLGPCGHRFHAGCWHETHQVLTRNYKIAKRDANVRRDLGLPVVEQPTEADYVRCPRCRVSVDWVADLTDMGVPVE
tara:strand:+ start:424 stop:897 length:474 start_codon:yes stop_codon:yes gene_type:complete